jgi:hypothetical protein
MTTETTLHGQKIAFPEVKDFVELFEDVRPWKYGQESRILLDLPSWEAGTWSDKQSKTRFKISSFLTVSGQTERRSYDVQARPVVLDFARTEILHTSNDQASFEVIVWDDGRALVTLQYSQIIGSHYLAIIDAKTIPQPPTPREEQQAQRDRYMNKEISHEEYYCWLSDFIGLPESLIPASNETVKKSTDPHLNDIPLHCWDHMDPVVRQYATAKKLPWSLSDTVCCLKAMARRRANKPE